MKVTQEMREALRKPLPKEAIKPHPTKTFLSSIKAIYVTERMNEVFGTGAWQLRVDPVSVSEKGMVVVKVVYTVPELGIYYECFGGNDNGGENSKNFDLGDAYKGATTDAITKIGSYLEIGLDVFKGIAYKSDSESTKPIGADTTPQVDKTWLNKGKEFDQIVEDLKSKKTTISKVLTQYKLSTVIRKELEAIK